MDGPAGEAEAYELLERLRWSGPPDRCPHCGARRCHYLAPRDGVRRTRTGAPTSRRVWKCAGCRRQFSVLTGTVLAGSRVPLRVWLAVLTAWGSGGRPTASGLAAVHGVTPEAARQLLRRVDAALAGRAPGPDLVRTLLAIPPAEAAEVRLRTPARLRPRRQVGPTASYG